MFRAQTNAFDDVVLKATDENLTSENWEYILVSWTPSPLSNRSDQLHRMYATRWPRPTQAPKMPSPP